MVLVWHDVCDSTNVLRVTDKLAKTASSTVLLLYSARAEFSVARIHPLVTCDYDSSTTNDEPRMRQLQQRLESGMRSTTARLPGCVLYLVLYALSKKRKETNIEGQSSIRPLYLQFEM